MTDKSGSPPCGLYIQMKSSELIDSSLTTMRQFAMTINRGSGYKKNFTIVEFVLDDTTDTAREKISALVEVAQTDGLVAIIRDDYKAAAAMDADGVIVGSIEEIKQARDLLGEDKIYGLSCDTSKELAQQAIEAKLDYVEFGSADKAPSTDLLSWWSTAYDHPCLARGPITNDNAGSYARAGAGFVDATNYISTQEKGTMQGTVNMLYALELVVEGQQVN